MSRTRALCIVGPTGVGKSELADRVAARLDGEVVSVDSMQIYRGMDIGTAKVRPEDHTSPLHMVDIADVREPYSVTRFQREARACTDDIASRGRVPILCGGSGLYLDAVIDEMSFPAGKLGDKRRESYECLARDKGPLTIYELLRSRDPKSAAIIHPNNTRRVIRALELLDEGKSYYEHHKGLKHRDAHYEATIWGLVMEREALYDRIDVRVDEMMRNGLIEEVRSLDANGLRESSTASQAIGYREMLEVLDGAITLSEGVELVKRNTRRYAKRQIAWLKRDGRARLVDVGKTGLEEAVDMVCDEWSQS